MERTKERIIELQDRAMEWVKVRKTKTRKYENSWDVKWWDVCVMVTGRKDVDVSQRNNGYRQTVKTQQNSSIKAKNNLQTQETGKPKETHT